MSLDAFLPERVRAIVRREIAGSGSRVRAILVAGSHARGEALPGSDLDLYLVLADGEPSRFSAGDEEGVFVERTAFDAASARRKIAANPMAWATFLDGRAVLDDGIAATLRAEAERAAARWRPDSADLTGCAHWLRSSIVKIEAALDPGLRASVAEDAEAKAVWIAATSLFELARGIHLVNGRPVVAAGAAWRALERLPLHPDPDDLRTILLGTTAQIRAGAFVSAARWTVSRLGSEDPG